MRSSKGKPSTREAITLKEWYGNPACTSRLSGFTIPTSSLTRVAISSMRAAKPSAMREQYLARSSTDVLDHAGNARRAACTARSTSSAVPSGMVPMVSSVVELTTAMVPVPVLGSHAPSM